MNSYTIDLSIYSIPDVKKLSLEEKKNKYHEFIKNIEILISILKPKKNNIKLYFFMKDLIKMKNQNSLFTKERCDEFKKLGIYHSNIDNFLNMYTELIDDLSGRGYNKKSDLKIHSKYITIELHTGLKINDKNLENTVNLTSNTNGISFLNKKSTAYLAFLNHYIYRDSKINRMVTSGKISDENVTVSAKINSITHNFINDDIPNGNINIENEIVEVCEFNEMTIRRSFNNINEALTQAKEDFKETLDFNENINCSIKEYLNILDKLKIKYPDDYKIRNHEMECPNTLYDFLCSLDKLVNYYKNSGNIVVRRSILNEYNRIEGNKNTCYINNYPICQKCRAFLRFCRYDCSDGDEKNINGKMYRIHAKPYSYSNDFLSVNKYIADLSLRIYYRWDEGKIQIGWIGKHL